MWVTHRKAGKVNNNNNKEQTENKKWNDSPNISITLNINVFWLAGVD